MKKNIALAIVLLIISIIMIIISNNMKNIKGTIVDITHYENSSLNSNILLNVNGEPYSISFKKIDLNKLDLNDQVSVKTNGLEMESYPVQMTGIAIKKIKNDSKSIFIDKTSNILFRTTYNDEDLSYNSKFKTKILKNKVEFNEFIESKLISTPEIKKLESNFEDKVAIISYTSMTSSGSVQFDGLYEDKDNIYVHMKINIKEITTDDLITRGSILFVDKQLSFKNFETLSKQIIEK